MWARPWGHWRRREQPYGTHSATRLRHSATPLRHGGASSDPAGTVLRHTRTAVRQSGATKGQVRAIFCQRGTATRQCGGVRQVRACSVRGTEGGCQHLASRPVRVPIASCCPPQVARVVAAAGGAVAITDSRLSGQLGRGGRRAKLPHQRGGNAVHAGLCCDGGFFAGSHNFGARLGCNAV